MQTKKSSQTSQINEPEFVRVPEVQARTGIKRGLCYRRIKDGTFKSVVLLDGGNKQGVRLIHWPSVKAYLHRLLAEQENATSQRQQQEVK